MKLHKFIITLTVAVFMTMIFSATAFATTSGGFDSLTIVSALKRFVQLLQYIAAVACVCFLAAAAFMFIRGGEASQWVSNCFAACLICGSVWGGSTFINWLMGGEAATIEVAAIQIINLIGC